MLQTHKSASALQREIADLEREIAATVGKREGIDRALQTRRQKLERLRSDLALAQVPGGVLVPALCSA